MDDIKLKVEYISIDKLKPYERNAKLHPQKQIEQIARSIKEYGMNDPIGVWKDNVIIEGHGRLEACKKLGIDTVPIVRLDHLTEEQRREYALVHKHEPCLYGWKDGASHFFIDSRTEATVIEDKIDINKLTKEQMKTMLKEMLSDKQSTTVMHEDKPQRNGEHPTMKPVKLIGREIKNSTRPGNKVLDSFGGSGTTLIACEQLGRKAFLCELDPHYCDVIIQRWENLTGKQAILMTEGSNETGS